MPIVRLSSAEFLENFDKLTNQALAEPVTIICNGQDRLVLLLIEEYERLKRRDRRIYAIEDMISSLIRRPAMMVLGLCRPSECPGLLPDRAWPAPMGTPCVLARRVHDGSTVCRQLNCERCRVRRRATG